MTITASQRTTFIHDIESEPLHRSPAHITKANTVKERVRPKFQDHRVCFLDSACGKPKPGSCSSYQSPASVRSSSMMDSFRSENGIESSEHSFFCSFPRHRQRWVRIQRIEPLANLVTHPRRNLALQIERHGPRDDLLSLFRRERGRFFENFSEAHAATITATSQPGQPLLPAMPPFPASVPQAAASRPRATRQRLARAREKTRADAILSTDFSAARRPAPPATNPQTTRFPTPSPRDARAEDRARFPFPVR